MYLENLESTRVNKTKGKQNGMKAAGEQGSVSERESEKKKKRDKAMQVDQVDEVVTERENQSDYERMERNGRMVGWR